MYGITFKNSAKAFVITMSGIIIFFAIIFVVIPNISPASSPDKLIKEIKVDICTAIDLKAGTIIRASDIAFSTGEDGTHGKPMYKTFTRSTVRYQNDQIVVLSQDVQVYLTDGGFYVLNTTKDQYLKYLQNQGLDTATLTIKTQD